MSTRWYFAHDGQKQGPVSWTEIESLRESGKLASDSLVWRKGFDQWRPLAEVEPANVASPPLPEPPPPPPASRAVEPTPTPAPSARASRRSRPVGRQPISLSPAMAIGILAIAILGAGAVGALTAVVVMQSSRSTSPSVVAEAGSGSNDRRQPAESDTPARVATDDSPLVSPKPSRDDEAVTEETPSREKTPPFVATPPTTADDFETAVGSGEAKPIVDPEPANSGDVASTETNKPPSNPTEKPEPVFPWLNSKLYQELSVSRRPSFMMIGRPIAMSQDYQMLSSLEVGEAAADGSFPVVQTVLETRLVGADDLTRAAMTTDLAALKGQSFAYRIHPEHGVIEFARKAGGAKPIDIKADTLEGAFSGAAMDDDGWRELAHLTFLQPPEPLKKGASWRRQFMHQWNSLGAWDGETVFEFDRRAENADWVSYHHEMEWKPPAGGAGLSVMKITSARFASSKAGGVVKYDYEQRRVAGVEEAFEVGGVMQAEFAGQTIPIEMSEKQTLKLRLLDQNPWNQ